MSVVLSQNDIQLKLAQLGIERSSFILESLNNPSVRIALDPAANIYPASMMKLSLAVAVALGLEQGRLLDHPITINEQQITTDDAPAPFVAGYVATVWELLHSMISASNNTATNVLLDYVDRRAGTEALQAIGCHRTCLRRYLSGSLPRLVDPLSEGENEHPACDSALLLRKIAERSVPFHVQLRAALDAQIWNSKFNRGLLDNDRFAHKTGETSDYCHDGGILTLSNGREYILVLYTVLPADDETDLKFGQLMNFLRTYL